MQARKVLWVVVAVLMVLPGAVARADSEKLPLLIEPEWLARNLGREDLVIVDVGRKPVDFTSGHIPGAVYLDRSAIYGERDGLEGMFPGVEPVVNALEEIGISNESIVIVYDGGNSLWATRAFWTLEYLGHKNVHVLNGGYQRWSSWEMPVSAEPATPARGDFTADVQHDRLATKDYVARNHRSQDVVIVDTRSAGEYNGTDVRAERGGHIPGAVHADWVLNTDENDQARGFLSEEELSEMYQALEVTPGKTAVTHCQTGVRGAHTYFVLRNLGYENVKLYDGSWVEWGNDPEAPIVK